MAVSSTVSMTVSVIFFSLLLLLPHAGNKVKKLYETIHTHTNLCVKPLACTLRRRYQLRVATRLPLSCVVIAQLVNVLDVILLSLAGVVVVGIIVVVIRIIVVLCCFLLHRTW